MSDTGIEQHSPPTPTWQPRPSLPPLAPRPETPHPSDGECPSHDDFDDPIASW